MTDPAPTASDSSAISSAFVANSVVVDFPGPIAIAFRRYCNVSHVAYLDRLGAAWSVVETVVRYLGVVALSDLLRAKGDLPAHAVFDHLRKPGSSLTLGTWVSLLRESARALADLPQPFVAELPGVCAPGGAFDVELLGALVKERNEWAHPGTVHVHSEDARDRLRRVRPLLEATLLRLGFLRRYPLGFVQASQRESGAQRFTLFSCTGAEITRVGIRELESQLPSDLPFLAHPSSPQALSLGPLLGQRPHPVAVRPTLYMFSHLSSKAAYLSRIDLEAIDVRDHWERELCPTRPADFGWLKGFAEGPRLLPVGAKIAQDLRQGDHDQLLGVTLGDFRLERLIGKGGFASVYLGRSSKGKLAAVKVLDPKMATESEAVRRFERETRILSTLDMPGLIACWGSGSELLGSVEANFYAMEFAPGGDLAQRLRRLREEGVSTPKPEGGFEFHALSTPHWSDAARRPRLILEIRELLAVSARLHERGLVHRDLKPHNVLVMEDGSLRLGDLGLVRDSESQSQLTTSGAVLGTLAYMAPEQRAGQEVAPSADVYGLGIILAELAVGVRPPSDKPLDQWKQLTKLPKGLRKLILRACRQDPSKRPPHAGALLEALDTFLTQQSIEVTELSAAATTVRSAPARGPSNRYLVIAVSLVLLAGLGSLGAWLSYSSQTGPETASASSTPTPTPSAATSPSASPSRPASSASPAPAGDPEWIEHAEAIAASIGVEVAALPRRTELRPLREIPSGYPGAGLWEFWHPASGSKPTVDPASEGLRVTAETSLVFVLVPGAAEFRMGSGAPDPKPNEIPIHTVKLDPYYLAKHELTGGQWNRLAPKRPPLTGDLRVPCTPTWNACREVFRSKGLELPSEAQWEWAATGPSPTLYPWGSQPPTATQARTWLIGDSKRGPDPSGSRPLGASWCGLEDLGGNLKEWCRDHLGGYDLPVSPGLGERLVPRNLATWRVARGGCWHEQLDPQRSRHRGSTLEPGTPNPGVGVRPMLRLAGAGPWCAKPLTRDPRKAPEGPAPGSRSVLDFEGGGSPTLLGYRGGHGFREAKDRLHQELIVNGGSAWRLPSPDVLAVAKRETGWTLEARFRVERIDGIPSSEGRFYGACLGARDDVGGLAFVLFPDGYRILTDFRVIKAPTRAWKSGKDHVVRVEVPPGSKQGLVLVDGVPVAVTSTGHATGQTPEVMFGDASNGGGAQVQWDYVRFRRWGEGPPQKLPSLAILGEKGAGELVTVWGGEDSTPLQSQRGSMPFEPSYEGLLLDTPLAGLSRVLVVAGFGHPAGRFHGGLLVRSYHPQPASSPPWSVRERLLPVPRFKPSTGARRVAARIEDSEKGAPASLRLLLACQLARRILTFRVSVDEEVRPKIQPGRSIKTSGAPYEVCWLPDGGLFALTTDPSRPGVTRLERFSRGFVAQETLSLPVKEAMFALRFPSGTPCPHKVRCDDSSVHWLVTGDDTRTVVVKLTLGGRLEAVSGPTLPSRAGGAGALRKNGLYLLPTRSGCSGAAAQGRKLFSLEGAHTRGVAFLADRPFLLGLLPDSRLRRIKGDLPPSTESAPLLTVNALGNVAVPQGEVLLKVRSLASD